MIYMSGESNAGIAALGGSLQLVAEQDPIGPKLITKIKDDGGLL